MLSNGWKMLNYVNKPVSHNVQCNLINWAVSYFCCVFNQRLFALRLQSIDEVY